MVALRIAPPASEPSRPPLVPRARCPSCLLSTAEPAGLQVPFVTRSHRVMDAAPRHNSVCVGRASGLLLLRQLSKRASRHGDRAPPPGTWLKLTPWTPQALTSRELWEYNSHRANAREQTAPRIRQVSMRFLYGLCLSSVLALAAGCSAAPTIAYVAPDPRQASRSPFLFRVQLHWTRGGSPRCCRPIYP